MTTKFITAIGRRKTAVASVHMKKAPEWSVTVNGKSAKDYFKTNERANVAKEALSVSGSMENYAVVAHVNGGGVSAQADALRHAISRAIIKAEPNTRTALKTAKFLMRDPRAKERKKPGLKKARKAPQWSKR